MAGVSVEVVGATEAISKMKETKGVISEKEKAGIKLATIYLQGEVKASIAGQRDEPTSVDTGRFLNSVDMETSDDDGRVFTNVPYAVDLEYGTSKMRARRHFNNSKDRNQQKIGEIINKAISS